MPTVFNSFSQADLPTSNTTLYTVPGSTTASITSAIFSNKSTSATVTVDVEIVRSGGTPVLRVVNDAPIPVGGSLELIANKPIVLETGDLIRALSSTATTVDVIGSVLEQS